MIKKHEPYIECRCLSNEFVKDVNKIFDEYIKLDIDKHGFTQATAEQIDAIEKIVKVLPPEERDSTRYSLLYSLEHIKENKTLGFIKRYLENCRCPPSVSINYKDGFHGYKNIKIMLEKMMDG